MGKIAGDSEEPLHMCVCVVFAVFLFILVVFFFFPKPPNPFPYFERCILRFFAVAWLC